MQSTTGKVFLLVCLFVLLSVSLVQSRTPSIPAFCRQFIDQANPDDVAAAAAATDPDSADEDESDVETSMQDAEDEINMLKLLVEFMEYVSMLIERIQW